MNTTDKALKDMTKAELIALIENAPAPALVAGKIVIPLAELNEDLQRAASLRGRVLASHGEDFADARREGVEIPADVMKAQTPGNRKRLRLLSAVNTLHKRNA